MEHGWIFGMHISWWLFWILMIILVAVFLEPMPKKEARKLRERPLDLLRRRFAAGEISTDEYRERKAVLEAELEDEPEDQEGRQ